jgi:hypothetical protein
MEILTSTCKSRCNFEWEKGRFPLELGGSSSDICRSLNRLGLLCTHSVEYDYVPSKVHELLAITRVMSCDSDIVKDDFREWLILFSFSQFYITDMKYRSYPTISLNPYLPPQRYPNVAEEGRNRLDASCPTSPLSPSQSS